MMGVQILEGDWNAEVAAGASGAGDIAAKNSVPSAQQRRWTAFRSWYRGGRVFDRADETLIAAATQRRPPSPGSLGRPLTPRMAPADGPQPAAPIAIEEGKDGGSPQATEKGQGEAENTGAAVPSDSDGGATAAAPVASAEAATASDAPEGVAAWPETGPVTPLEGMMRGRRTTPPAPPAPPAAAGEGARVHVTLLKTNEQPPAAAARGRDSGSKGGAAPAAAAAGAKNSARIIPAQDEGGVDAACLAGIAGWDADGDGEAGDDALALMWDQSAAGGLRLGRAGRGEGGGTTAAAEGLSTGSREGGTAAAKKLRMEARRKFLAARTISSKQAARKASARSGNSAPKSHPPPALRRVY